MRAVPATNCLRRAAEKVLVEGISAYGPIADIDGVFLPRPMFRVKHDSFRQRWLDPLTTDCLTSNAFSKMLSLRR